MVSHSPAGLVPAAWAVAALADDGRPVPHPGVGGDAAADPGRSGAAEVSRVARQYPSLEALAGAAEDDVASTWRPLGYNIRPRRLQAIARESVARFGGKLPSDKDTLLSFKGIGEYTAGAIRSFAFRERAAILDTNVARVLYRVFVAAGDAEGARDAAPSLADLRGACPAQARLRLQPGTHGPWRHGLHRSQTAMPRLSPLPPLPFDWTRRRLIDTRTMPPRVVVAAAVIERDGRLLVTRRLAGTHLAGTWEFPGGKCEEGESLAGAWRGN